MTKPTGDTGKRCPRCDCADRLPQCDHCKTCPHARPIRRDNNKEKSA